MSMKTQAYVCKEKGAKLELQEIELPALKANQVTVKLDACGLCHTDCHMCNNDWGVGNFPMVAGHEGVGKVTEVGSDVSGLAVGDTVGVGWLRDSCGGCRQCAIGKENLCTTGYQGTYLGSNAGCWGKDAQEMGGCFAQHVRINSKFAFKIPAGLSGNSVPPLMCAGTTLYEPVADYVKAGTRVGIIGCGGLGHMGIKFAAAVGGVVTAISRHAGKEDALKAMGATSFVDSTNADAMKAAAGSLDVLLDTTPVALDLEAYSALLGFGGAFVKLGVPPGDASTFSFNYIPLVFTGKKIACGSIVCGSARTNDMLALCAARNLTADVEVVKFADINEVMEKLLKEDTKSYRYVLEW